MENSGHFCENCGSPLERDASFCEACGAPVTGAGTENTVPQAPPVPAAPPRPVTPPPPAYYQPAARSAPPAPPPGYYPPPPSYYPPPPPAKRKTSTGLIAGGVILGLVVCCGLVALVFTLAGGATLWNQFTGAAQNLPPVVVAQDTPAPAEPLVTQDTDLPAEPSIPPVTRDTDVPAGAVKPTLTSEPAPNALQPTPVLPVPQGDILDFTDDLMTNDNHWPVGNQNTGPRTGFFPSAYYIDTNKQQGEIRALIPKINNNQYTIKDFEIEFYGLSYMGDGYLGLDFHYVDDQNYYQAVVKDGKFLIRKKINGQFLNLTHGWVASNSIMGGPNKITVVVHGNVIQMKVNDDVMAQLKDDSLPEGAVMLTGGVLPEAPDGTVFEGRFNNFHVLWFVQP